MPELLYLIDVKGDIVTADSMNCQKKIVKKTIEKKNRLYNRSETESTCII